MSNYTYPSNSHRLSSLSGAVSRSFAYDAAGNATAISGVTFAYDGRGRMKQAASVAYLVNGLGERVKKTGATETYFAYDEAGHLIGEYDGTGAPIEETLWLADTPVAVVKPDGSGGFAVFYIWSDHLNTPRMITDAANYDRWEWPNADPFGNNAPIEDPSGQGVFSYNLRFPGQYYDVETGKHYNYFRDYDASIGRYVESDPIGLIGGINTYGYVEGNPLVYIDADGNLVELPQGFVNFAAGAGDVILLGFGQDIRDALGIDGDVNQCTPEYNWGTWAGIAATFATGIAGGVRAAGVKGAGREFSHWIPRRMGGPRSIGNGNFVSAARHYYHDPFRYPKGWRDLGPKWPGWMRQLDRIPNLYKGGAGGAAYGVAGKANASCGCGG